MCQQQLPPVFIKNKKINNEINLKRNKRNNQNNFFVISEVVINTGKYVFSFGVVLNSKLYIGSEDSKVYEYDPVTNQPKVVITTLHSIYSSGVVLNNKVYFGSEDDKVYEYDSIR